MPQVTWWRDNHLIDSSFEKTFSKTVQNTLSVPQVTREDLGATLTCQASNNNISAPASTRATVDLKCKINMVLVCHSFYLFICLFMQVKGLVGSDRPKQCFTVLPEPNRTSQSKFCFPNKNRTELNM